MEYSQRICVTGCVLPVIQTNRLRFEGFSICLSVSGMGHYLQSFDKVTELRSIMYSTIAVERGSLLIPSRKPEHHDGSVPVFLVSRGFKGFGLFYRNVCEFFQGFPKLKKQVFLVFSVFGMFFPNFNQIWPKMLALRGKVSFKSELKTLISTLVHPTLELAS